MSSIAVEKKVGSARVGQEADDWAAAGYPTISGMSYGNYSKGSSEKSNTGTSNMRGGSEKRRRIRAIALLQIRAQRQR